MDGLILCRGRLAENPFYVGDMPLYSIEELCYYIYENIYVISEDFFSTRLVHFLEEELGEKEIAQALMVLMKNELKIRDAVLTILMNVDYYSREQIDKLRKILNELDNLKDFERMKACGDARLKIGKYGNALEDYARALELAEKKDATVDFVAGLYHNRGVAYGRMLLYRQAAECFRKAYKLSANAESKKQWLIALQLGNRKEETEIDEEENCEITNIVESAMDHASMSGLYIKVQNALSKRQEGSYSEYCDQCDNLIEEFKKSCLNSMA